MKKALFLVLAFSIILASTAESPNPFTSRSSASALVSGGPGVSAAIAPLLRSLSDRLVELTRALHEKGGGYPLLALLLAAFAYGAFHALGPGHGKTMASTLFIAREARLAQSLTMGFSIALVHSISALALVTVLYFVIHGIFSTDFEAASRIIRILSFGVAALIGASMLLKKLRRGSHEHHAHESGARAASGTLLSSKEIRAVAFASGIVPCPGASAIILLSLSLNMILVSVLSVAAISLGMGLTISGVGAIAILSKRGFVGAAGDWFLKDDEKASKLRRVIELSGAVVLFGFGLLFLIAQFY
jgi:ABC-type nickel/cobalt efflux system permease component RcnA